MSDSKVYTSLTAEHLVILKQRGISPEAAKSAGLLSVDLRLAKIHRDKYPTVEPLPWPNVPLHDTTGIAIVYHDGKKVRIRSDKTEYTKQTNEGTASHGTTTVNVPRYICQYGIQVGPYVTNEVRAIAGDVSRPICIVEAPLKAISLSSNGFPAIGLGGVLAGAHDAQATSELREIVAHPDLRQINWKGRHAFLVFDAGIETNPLVALGCAYAMLALRSLGAIVHVTSIPFLHGTQAGDPERGNVYFEVDQGPDDYLVRNGVAALAERLAESASGDILTRFEAADAKGCLDLLRGLYVQAVLHSSRSEIDLVAIAAKRKGVTKTAIKEKAAEFARRLQSRSGPQGAEWKQGLQRTVEGIVRLTSDNIQLCLRDDPRLKGLLSFNEFGQAVIFRRQPPWADLYAASASIKDGSPWDDEDATRLGGYLSKHHGMTDIPAEKILKSVAVVAKDHPSHPVRDYLNGLAWDGVGRLDTLATAYLDAFQPEDEGEHARLMMYYKIVVPQWFLGAVARIMKPGCQVDHTLVLEGSQGDGKTSAFRKLGGDWYSDATQDDLANKEAAIKLQAAWIFVFDENAISKRADAVRMKEFLTKLYDEYVPKFSNIKRKQPRQNAFAITTNDSEYLSDVTGNRRYLPMRVGSIDLEALERDRDHFWAEALHRYNAGEQFWPTEEQEAILAVEQEKRRKPDPWEPTIAEYIDDKGEVTIEEILVKALDIKPKEGDKLDRARVSACLQVMGWKQAEKMKRVYGIPSRYYVPSEPAEIARKADVAKLLVEAAAALEDV